MRISDWSSDVCSSDLFELVVHDDLLSLFLVSARASRRISTPPLMAMMAVAKPTRRSGQLVPSHSTSTPAIRPSRPQAAILAKSENVLGTWHSVLTMEIIEEDRKSTRLNSSH